MVGESARWGDSKREPPIVRENWISAVSRVMNNYLPFAPAIVLQQLRNRGLYPNLAAPNFSQFGGSVPAGYPLTMTHTNASGVIYFTPDGSDPRVRGGAVALGARLTPRRSSSTRRRSCAPASTDGTNWSALVEATFYTAAGSEQAAHDRNHVQPARLRHDRRR